MDDAKRPGGEDKAWVDAGRTTEGNAFDTDDEYSGQEYDRDREAAQGKADRAGDTPHARTKPEHLPPEDPRVVGIS